MNPVSANSSVIESCSYYRGVCWQGLHCTCVFCCWVGEGMHFSPPEPSLVRFWSKLLLPRRGPNLAAIPSYVGKDYDMPSEVVLWCLAAPPSSHWIVFTIASSALQSNFGSHSIIWLDAVYDIAQHAIAPFSAAILSRDWTAFTISAAMLQFGFWQEFSHVIGQTSYVMFYYYFQELFSQVTNFITLSSDIW